MTSENTASTLDVGDPDSGPWLVVCALDELAVDDGVCVLVGGEQVAIFRTGAGEEVYAIGNHDPIGGINVLSRGIVGDIGGEPVVASPLYKQHYSLRSGQCLEDATVRVACYPLRIVAGQVQIRLLP